jgi:Heparinase II/III-like protein
MSTTRPTPPSPLTRNFDGTALQAVLIDRRSFRPQPVLSDRAAWEGLPAALRSGIIAQAERTLAEPWELLKATVLLGFVRTGNRTDYEGPHAARRHRLATWLLAECVENKGRFLDAIADGAWAMCEETYWGGPAHLFMQRRGFGLPDVTEPTVDLAVGEVAALLAWTHYLLGERLDAVHPMIRERIRLEVDRRLLVPCLERDDFWWMGWHRDNRPVNNWNPWVNSNWLACVLLLEEDPVRRARAVHKIMRILDIFIDNNPRDGGCDEGPAYWARAAGSLFECLELLHGATLGRIDIYREPLIAEMGRFVMRTHVNGPWFVNFADAPARPGIEAVILHLYGRRIGDPALEAFGAWFFQQRPGAHIGGSMGRVLPSLWVQAPLAGSAASAPLLRDVWLPEIQVMTARDAAGSSAGLFVAAKGGHNEESHNHNDCGTFVAYLDGWPLFIDVGVETYTAKTFNMKERYKIWTMQSQWHNLPTINGRMQSDGRAFAAREVAYSSDDKEASLRLDLAAAWPADVGIRSWIRTIRLLRNKALVVTDDYHLDAAREPVVFNFMTTRPLDIGTPGVVRMGGFPGEPSSRGADLRHDPLALTPEVDTVEVTDPNLRSNWGPTMFRLRLIERTPSTAACREFRIAAT